MTLEEAVEVVGGICVEMELHSDDDEFVLGVEDYDALKLLVEHARDTVNGNKSQRCDPRYLNRANGRGYSLGPKQKEI